MAKTTLDPILFEILRHRVEEIVAEAYYTISRVSGNAVVAEVGDHEEALLDADGNTVMVAGGIVEWTSVLEVAAKHIIKAYEDNPGINEGDQFIFNHSYIAAVHGMDVQMLAPVFWEGKRIAWIVAAGHVMDMGGMEPGGFMLHAHEFYQEGLAVPGLKIMEKGRIRKDIEDTLRAMVREPDLFMLDVSAKIAADNAASDRLIDMVKAYGIDVVLTLFKQLRQYSEDLIRAKLKTIPDGTWNAIHYVESIVEDEPYLKVQLALTKQGDSLTMDFTGSSPQSKGSQNVAEPGAISNAICSYLICFAYDAPWSEGVWKPIKFILPEGTVVNPVFPAAVSSNTPLGVGYVIIGTVQDALSKMLLCTEQWREDAYANTGAGGHSTVWEGYWDGTKGGSFFETQCMDNLVGGMGGLPNMDGDDACGNMWTPKTKIANVESNELLFPVLYLTRQEAIDTGGPGKFRGGVANRHAILSWGAETFTLHGIDWGLEPRMGNGLAGGYPANNTTQWIVKNSNILDRLKNGDFPRDIEEIGGEWESLPAHYVRPFDEGEVFIAYESGGGGFGDPIERDSELVLKDVTLGYVSLESAEEVYGVVIDPEEPKVDDEKTKELRRKIIAERRRIGKS